MKLMNPEAATGVSERYYGGLISADMIHTPLGLAQIALGLLVILGLFRTVIYPINAVVLVGSALAIWKYLLDPFGMWLVAAEDTRLLFFPSSTVAVASLVLLAFKGDDALSLDRLMGKS